MSSDLIVPQANLAAARRGLLVRGGQMVLSATAIAVLAGCESMAGKSMKTADAASMSDDVQILNTALGLEQEAIAAYQVGAESGLLQKPVMAVAVKFQGQHKQHADTLSSVIAKLGGTPVQPKSSYDFPVSQLKTQADVLRFAAGLEKGAASAYLGAVPAFENRDLAKAAASILGDETMHWAVLRNALGEDPVPVAFIA